jgi:hypothetical protein
VRTRSPGLDPDKRAHRDSEVRLRETIWSDVRSDPLWLAGILAKRFLATVSLYKLWPWAPRDGISFYPAASPNEGVIDNYYTLTQQADWLALGPVVHGSARPRCCCCRLVALLAPPAYPRAVEALGWGPARTRGDHFSARLPGPRHSCPCRS